MTSARQLLDDVLQWARKRKCRHRWRPAATSKGPARHCAGQCGETEVLSTAEFYAEFGEVGGGWVFGESKRQAVRGKKA